MATAPPAAGVILAWNNLYPAGPDTARWYARTVGFTGSYHSSPSEIPLDVPYLLSGLRIFTGLIHVGTTEDVFTVPGPATGVRYLHRSGRWVTNPWHPEAVPAIERGIDGLLARKTFSPELRENLRYVILDTESVIAPPAKDLEAPGQAEAVALVADAARKAGALREGEEFPLFSYGFAPGDARLFDATGALRGDSPEIRVLDWWFGQGQGPGRLWRAAVARLRAGLPRIYATTDAVAGCDARPTIPVFAAKANGLDFVQNWFNVTGRGDRLPLYAALMVLLGKASGLPVVQGPQLFSEVDVPRAYAHDLILTANLLTLAFNPRNGAADPDAPWGVMHWGVRGVTEGVTADQLRSAHKDATEALLSNMAANQADVIPAIRATRRFLDEHQAILAGSDDVPPRVGIVLTKGGQYVAPKGAWPTYYRRLGEFPYALLMAHVPFAFVPEDEDLSRFDVLILPDASFPTDRLVEKLARFRGAVTGSGVPPRVAARIPGWKAPLPAGQVGEWPGGGCPGGGRLKADEMRTRLLDRAARYKTYFAALLGAPEVEGDPEVIVNVVRWRGKKVVFAVNHRMRAAGDPWSAQVAEPWKTEIAVLGHWKDGRYSQETGRTAFPVAFPGAGARVIVLEPAGDAGKRR